MNSGPELQQAEIGTAQFSLVDYAYFKFAKIPAHYIETCIHI